MTLRLRALALAIACTAAATASAQTASWPTPTAPPAHAVPWGHAAATPSLELPPPPPRPAYDPERTAVARRVVEPPRPTVREVRPISAGRVVAQVAVGALGGLGGAAVGVLPLILFGNNAKLSFGLLYALGALGTAGAATGVGRGFGGDGTFAATLLGASLGGTAGWVLHFWAFDRGSRAAADERNDTAGMISTWALMTAGAVVGYALSASSEEEIAESRRAGARARLVPTLSAGREGLVVGLAGAL